MITIEGFNYNTIKDANTDELLLAKNEKTYDFAWLMNMLGSGGFEISSFSPGEQTRPELRRDYDLFFCESFESSILVSFNYSNNGVNISLEVFEKTLADPSFRNVNGYLRDNGIPVYVFIPSSNNPDRKTKDSHYPLYDWME